MLREIKLVLKSNFESLPLFQPSFAQFTNIWARGPWPQGMRKEPDFFYHNSGMQNSMRPFPVHPLCFWWCIYSCYSLHSVKSLCLIRSVSSGLKLLNTFAHTVVKMKLLTLESAYLNYAKNSSCRLLCINALLIHHIIFSTVITVIKNLVRN